MFSNIGEKIKILTQVFCWIGIAASVIGGIVLIVEGIGLEEPIVSIMGFFVMFLGALFSWLSSFVSYGYGEMISQLMEINENTEYTNALLRESKASMAYTTSPVEPAYASGVGNDWYCTVCGNRNPGNAPYCSSCKRAR